MANALVVDLQLAQSRESCYVLEGAEAFHHPVGVRVEHPAQNDLGMVVGFAHKRTLFLLLQKHRKIASFFDVVKPYEIRCRCDGLLGSSQLLGRIDDTFDFGEYS